MNDIIQSVEFFHPSSAVHLALPEASKALEQAWQRRRQELAGWQPSGGWLVDPHANAQRREKQA
jgi:hypothetical protein